MAKKLGESIFEGILIIGGVSLVASLFRDKRRYIRINQDALGYREGQIILASEWNEAVDRNNEEQEVLKAEEEQEAQEKAEANQKRIDNMDVCDCGIRTNYTRTCLCCSTTICGSCSIGDGYCSSRCEQ